MPSQSKARNGRRTSAIEAPPKFKYRSIGEIEKRKVHEIARGNLEGEHYRIQAEIDVLSEQPLGSEPNAAEQREDYFKRLREQQDILEGMIRTHNEKIADIDAETVAAAEEE
jgi:hypothetical protein